LSVWVHLSAGISGDRVIFTSKHDSCPATPETAGMKLSISNEPNSENRFLVFEYANRFADEDECLRFDTSDRNFSIPLDLWVQIGIVVSYSKAQEAGPQSPTTLNVKFYIDGSLVKNIQTNKKLIPVTNREQKKLAQGHVTKIGESFDGTNSLEGRLAMLALWVGGENTDVQASDALMRTIFRTGIDEEAMLNMHSQGFVKSPSLLYSFEQDTVSAASMHAPISEAKESIRSVTASIHRGVIPYYQPYNGGEISQVGKKDNSSFRQNLLFLRRLHLQSAMKRVWKSYCQYALGKDELEPLTRKGRVSWGNNGALIIESMDTLWLMNLKDEFVVARDWVRDSFSFDNNVDVVSVSKTTSRILGGLISAFDLSAETILLEKAADLANRLYPAFSSSPSGIPFTLGNLNKPHYFNSVMNTVPLVDIESLQLEFRRLSKVLDKPIYAKAVKKIYDITASISLQTDGNTIPQNLVLDDSNKPSFEGKIKYFGPEGKLFFETLLKVSIQVGDINNKYRSIYDQGVNYMIENLLRKSKATGLTFIADINEGEIVNKMDHSLCSYAGTLVLGAYTHPAGLNHEIAQRDLRIGEDLARTCYSMYSQMKSGLSPESVFFNMDSNVPNETVSVPPNSSFYRLRSEFAESLFILYQLTQNSIYQEWGWKIFESIENYCRTDVAYATLKDVNDPSKGFHNEMDSNFISKTLKYLYLLQDPYTEIDVLKHMFNGHGHPIKTV